MKQRRKTSLFGMTQGELAIMFFVIVLFCVAVLIVGYIIYISRPIIPAAMPPTTTPPPTTVPTLTPINPPLPLAATATIPPLYTATPIPTDTATPLTPTSGGTLDNPFPIGTSYTVTGLGTLTLLNTSWIPDQKNWAIATLTFRCERPYGQICNTTDFVLTTLGATTQKTYQQSPSDPAIPNPSFSNLDNPPVPGGVTFSGYAGWNITKPESGLLMRVEVFGQTGAVYFKMTR